MNNAFTRIMQKYGEDTVIEESGTVQTARTFIQPIMSKGQSALKYEMSLLGQVDTSRYYWFAPESITFDRPENAVVTIGDRKYDVIKAEQYCVLGGPSHWEAVLKVREDEYIDGV